MPDQHKVILKLRNKYSAMRRIVESGSSYESRIAPKVRCATGRCCSLPCTPSTGLCSHAA